ncbi:putative transcription factor bhlh protein [Venturia nashicola]|nr:putative transcription factor bhlh protein [Venturia nashicola]
MDYTNQSTPNTSVTWSNDYPLHSPSIDGWLNQNEWNFFENEPVQPPTLDLDQYISPQNLCNISSTSVSPHNHHAFSEATSPETPSLYDEDLHLKQEPSYTPSPTNAIPTAPRKRGRPPTARPSEDTTYDESTQISKPTKPSKRQPHNQVERKYRQGLNAELERLKKALPTFHNWQMASSCGASGMPKTSKAGVLAGAVAYIQDMERECDHLRRENELLKSGRGVDLRWQYE